jgi:hypothetical protein
MKRSAGISSCRKNFGDHVLTLVRSILKHVIHCLNGSAKNIGDVVEMIDDKIVSAVQVPHQSPS